MICNLFKEVNLIFALLNLPYLQLSDSTALILLLYCSYLPRYPSFYLGLCVGFSNALTGSALLHFSQTNTFWIIFNSSLSSVLSAVIYWVFFEENQKTMSSMLCRHYEKYSSLKLVKKIK